MKRIFISIMFFTVIALISCSNERLDLSEISIDDITEVSVPSGETLPEGQKGVAVEQGPIADIEWEVIYETNEYNILGRDVPEDMIFYSIGYLTSDECLYGEQDVYKYIVKVNEKYYNLKIFNDEYDILNCNMLNELASSYQEIFG